MTNSPGQAETERLALAVEIEQAIADFYPAWERKPDFARFRSVSRLPQEKETQ